MAGKTERKGVKLRKREKKGREGRGGFGVGL